MNDINSYFRISKLISRKVDDTISKEELEELSGWLEKEENQKLYSKITNKDHFEKWKNDLSKKDSEAAWKQFEKAVNPENKKSTTISTILKYAAIFLLPLLVLASLLHYFSYDEPVNTPANMPVASIDAVISKPRLILDNGKKLNLEDEKLTAFNEKDGTKIKNEKGKLSYNEAETKPSKAILYHTVVIPKGSEYEIRLSDGSKVVLNSLSTLKYPVQFTEKSREVELTGEGYFEVAKDTKRPFTVKVDGMNVQVLGTKFNVKAYDTDKNIVTTLVEGSVEVEANANFGEKIKLSPNEQAKLNKKHKTFSVKEVDVASFIAWKEGVLVFRNERLEDIMISLARWYDIEANYLLPEIKDQRFGGTFKRDGDLSLILKMLSYTNKVECQLDGDTITFDIKK